MSPDVGKIRSLMDGPRNLNAKHSESESKPGAMPLVPGIVPGIRRFASGAIW